MAATKALVLVSGANGYLGLHTVKTLLGAGYAVRATVRDPNNEKKCAPIRALCTDPNQLTIVRADLLDKDCWGPAVEGVDYVLHLASPLTTENVAEEVLVKPAKEGALNVLTAVANARHPVKRVVLTSSFAAVGYGQTDKPHKTYSEADWTVNSAPDSSAYVKSKAIAERTAWDYAKEHGIELATINPGMIFGPPLAGNDAGASVQIVRDIMTRALPALPHVKMPFVDVRDVAKAHLKAMTTPEAANKRFLLSAHVGWLIELSEALREEFAGEGFNPINREAPKFLLRLGSCFNKQIAETVPRVNYDFEVDNSNLRNILGIQPMPYQQSLRDMGHALIKFGFVQKK